MLQGRTARQFLEHHREGVDTASESEGYERQQGGEFAEVARRELGRGRIAVVPERDLVPETGRRYHTDFVGHVEREQFVLGGAILITKSEAVYFIAPFFFGLG